MADAEIYHEIYGLIKSRKNLKVTIATASNDICADTEIDLTLIEYDYEVYQGDAVKISISKDHLDQTKILRIQPQDPLQKLVGKITQLSKSFGVVDESNVFFIDKEIEKYQLKIDDEVNCMLVSGFYDAEGKEFENRVVTIHKNDDDEMKKIILNDISLNSTKHEIVDVDDDAEKDVNGNLHMEIHHQMTFDSLKDQDPGKMHYDLPYGLYERLRSNDGIYAKKEIMKILASYIPEQLNYETYQKWFHALIFLDEIEMKKSFEKYKSSNIYIQPDRKCFAILCGLITELRPPIAPGDKIQVTSNDFKTYYGVVKRVNDDRFILKFKKDFEEDYIFGQTYKSIQFTYSRTMYLRKHSAVDYAKIKMPETFLFPKKLSISNTLQLNVSLDGERLMLDGAEIPIFNSHGLNIEQKQAVVHALKGECRPLPFIIFGPPGTGKTSTLIEITLQVFKNINDSKILVATQSNTAANILASRLIKGNPDIGKSMIRLVSNAALERKSLPRDLHEYCACIRNANIDEEDIEDPTQLDVKKNCELDYLKNFRVIIGTCVGLGVIFDSEFNNDYFTHVLIDEAAQCNECEAMIPITSMNIKHGQVIMAGDPIQLPPITLSNHAKHYNLDKSMLERYLDAYKKMDGVIPSEENGYDQRLVAKLRRSYRALPSILNFYNNQFYESQLIAEIHPETSREAFELNELSAILPRGEDASTNNPFGVYFVNVSGKNERQRNTKSWSNSQEVEIIMQFVKKLMDKNVAVDDIGIISPYFAQVKAIKKDLSQRKKEWKKIAAGTVEEFQGEEKKIILISAVKTAGLPTALKFIFCPKRLNTAISRARMLLVVFGKVTLLEQDCNWKELIQYCYANKSYVDGIDLITEHF